MGYSTVQYSIVQYSTVQYSTVQYSTAQYSTVQSSTVLDCTVLYCTVLYCTVLYSTVQYSTVQYSTVQYSTVLYCTVLWLHDLGLHVVVVGGQGLGLPVVHRRHLVLLLELLLQHLLLERNLHVSPRSDVPAGVAAVIAAGEGAALVTPAQGLLRHAQAGKGEVVHVMSS